MLAFTLARLGDGEAMKVFDEYRQAFDGYLPSADERQEFEVLADAFAATLAAANDNVRRPGPVRGNR